MTKGAALCLPVSANQYLTSELSLSAVTIPTRGKLTFHAKQWNRTGERLVEMLRVTNPLNHRVYSAQRLRSRQVVEQRCSANEFVFLKPARHSTPTRDLNTNRSARGFMTGARRSWSERQHTAASRQKVCDGLGRLQAARGNIFLMNFKDLKKEWRQLDAGQGAWGSGLPLKLQSPKHNKKPPLKTKYF